MAMRALVETPDRLPLPPEPRRRFHRTCRRALRPLFRACFGMAGEGTEHIPATGPYLLAANHQSMLDWAFLSYYLPDLVRFVVHREYFAHPLLAVGLRFTGAGAVGGSGADAAGLRLARAVLAAGEPLVVFPEGAISRTGRPLAAQPGVIALAAAARVPILPAAVRGAFECFPRHRRLPRPGAVSVAFGRLLPPPPVVERPAQRALATGLMRTIEALLDGAPPPEAPW
jgi:1-acyl-sn-glycerol-3-phosphate acyltransferase